MLLLQNESELLEAQMQREEAQLSVSICEHAIQEEREQELLDLASFWKKKKNANKVAELIEEAAEAYEKKGLFKKRY